MTVRSFIRAMMMLTIVPWFAAAGGYAVEGKWALAGIATCYAASNLLLLFVGEG